MMISKIEKGIHTVEVNALYLAYSAVQMIVEDLYQIAEERKQSDIIYEIEFESEPKTKAKPKSKSKSKFKSEDESEATNTDRSYQTNYDLPDGIIMKLHQTVSCPSRIRFIMNPSTLSNGEYSPLKLYQPKKKGHVLDDAMKDIKREFKKKSIHRNWSDALKEISLSRVDLTWNLYFPKDVDLVEVIRLFKHGCRPKKGTKKKYKVETFNDKVKDDHSFRISSGDVTLTVYDKGFETKHHKKIDTDEDNILRIEFSLKRDAYLRLIGPEAATMSWDEVLHHAYDLMSDLLETRMKALFPRCGDHLPYQKAVAIIEEKITDENDKERMLYLLKKTSRSDHLTTAIMKLQKKYDIKDYATKTLLSKFDEINVNPITLKKDSAIKRIPSFRTMGL